MIKSSRNIFGTIELENFNYIETKKNVEQLFSKYRSFKTKEEIIEKRYILFEKIDNYVTIKNGKKMKNNSVFKWY